jgi:hypothetical protein
VGRRRVSNVPIGSAGPHAAMAKASRRRLNICKKMGCEMTLAVTERVRSVPPAARACDQRSKPM